MNSIKIRQLSIFFSITGILLSISLTVYCISVSLFKMSFPNNFLWAFGGAILMYLFNVLSMRYFFFRKERDINNKPINRKLMTFYFIFALLAVSLIYIRYKFNSVPKGEEFYQEYKNK